MGKKLKKIVYFFLKYHCPVAAEEFSKSLKFGIGDPPDTTLENIYIEWKKIKTQNVEIGTQVTPFINGTKVDNNLEISKPFTNDFKNKNEKNQELNKLPSNGNSSQLNGLIPRSVVCQVLNRIPDPSEINRLFSYDCVIDSVVNRIRQENILKPNTVITRIEKSPTKSTQVNMAAIKEKMQKSLDKSFVSTNNVRKNGLDADNVSKAKTIIDPSPAHDECAKNGEVEEVQSETLKKKKVKKAKLEPYVEQVGTLPQALNQKDDCNPIHQRLKEIKSINQHGPSNVEHKEPYLEEPLANKPEKKVRKKGKKTEVSENVDKDGGPPPRKKKLQETKVVTPSIDLIGHPSSNDLSAFKSTKFSKNSEINHITNGYGSESPNIQEVRMSKPFRRIDVYGDIKIDPKLNNNSFEAMKGAVNSWGEKANDVLKYTKGKSFKHEKTKKKRGTYSGGAITLGVNSIKFSDEDE